MQKFSLSCLIVIGFMQGCGSAPGSINSEDEWRLAWRVWEADVIVHDFEAGAKKFDSLVKLVSHPPEEVVYSGLKCYAETNQYTKAFEFLKTYPNPTALDLCKEKWFMPPNTSEWKSMCDLMTPSREVTLPQVRDDLLKMYINDQYARGRRLDVLIRETGYRITSKEIYDADVSGTDRINIEKLKIIIEEIGFPDVQMVGKSGMRSIYTIIRNANRDPEFQISQLKNVKAAADRGEISMEDYAFLYDQAEINHGRKQLYGTHFSSADYAEHRVVLLPVAEEENLNQRRMNLGLMPIESTKKLLLHLVEPDASGIKS